MGLPFPGWISETDCGETLGVCLQTDFNPWEIHERVASLKEANYGDPCVADYDIDINEALFGQVGLVSLGLVFVASIPELGPRLESLSPEPQR